VPLVLSSSPLYLLMGTVRDAPDMQLLATRVLDLNDPFGDRQIDEIADALVKAWFGMERWTVERLWRQVLGQWGAIDGELLKGGVDVTTYSPARASAVVYRLLLEWVSNSGDKNKAERWRQELSTPPPRTARRVVSADDNANNWKAVAALMGAAQSRG
jgi:hypothetical protein